MKKKDLIALVIAVIIFLVAGYLAYTQLMPKKSAQTDGVKVEVVGVIESGFDDSAMTQLTDPTQTRDFGLPFDLAKGLGNAAVFGQ